MVRLAFFQRCLWLPYGKWRGGSQTGGRPSLWSGEGWGWLGGTVTGASTGGEGLRGTGGSPGAGERLSAEVKGGEPVQGLAQETKEGSRRGVFRAGDGEDTESIWDGLILRCLGTKSRRQGDTEFRGGSS